MNTTNLLIVFLLFIALLLMQCSAPESPIIEVPEGVQADNPIRLKDYEFQPKGSGSIVE